MGGFNGMLTRLLAHHEECNLRQTWCVCVCVLMVPPCVATALVDEADGEPRTRIAESHSARTQGEVGPGRGRSKGLSMTQSMFMGSSSASAFPALVWQVFAIADGGDRDAAMLSEPLGLGSMDAAAIVPASALGDAGLMLGDILSTDIETAQRVGFFFRVVHAKPSALKQTGRLPSQWPRSSDFAITAHALRHVDRKSRTCTISLDPSVLSQTAEPSLLWQPPIGLTQKEWHCLVAQWDASGDVAFDLPESLGNIDPQVVREACSRLVAAEAFPALTDIATVMPTLEIRGVEGCLEGPR